MICRLGMEGSEETRDIKGLYGSVENWGANNMTDRDHGGDENACWHHFWTVTKGENNLTMPPIICVLWSVNPWRLTRGVTNIDGLLLCVRGARLD